MSNYSNLTALVSTQWVDDHKNDPDVVVVEVDVDTNSYDEGHIPGAVGWNWNTQLCDTVQRDIIKKADLEILLGNSGISNDTIVTIYGDQDNWFAAWAFWQLKLYRHHDVRLMDGGRKKWIEEGRELTTDAPAIKPATYSAPEPDLDTRAFLPHVQTRTKPIMSSWLMCALRMNLPEKFWHPPDYRKPASVEVTFQVQRTFPGLCAAMRTVPLNPTMSSKSYIAQGASNQKMKSSPTAVLESVLAIRGSF